MSTIRGKRVRETAYAVVDNEGCVRIALDVYELPWKPGNWVRVTVERISKGKVTP
jgi:hypothetical protein